MFKTASSTRPSTANSSLQRSGLLVLGCLMFAVLSQQASARADNVLEQLHGSSIVGSALIEALNHDEQVYARISFLLPSAEDPRYMGHPAQGSDVNPLIVDLVNIALPGDMSLEDQGLANTLTAWLNLNGILTLLDNPNIIAIELADEMATESSGEPTSRSHTTCSPSSTTACLQSGRFSVNVTHGGTTSRVLSVGSESALFYTYGTSNWEILVKVLNGCAINGHHWLFSAGATTVSYSFTVQDHEDDILVSYPNASCPVVNLTAFDC